MLQKYFHVYGGRVRQKYLGKYAKIFAVYGVYDDRKKYEPISASFGTNPKNILYPKSSSKIGSKEKNPISNYCPFKGCLVYFEL
jgi:hypothetical protein